MPKSASSPKRVRAKSARSDRRKPPRYKRGALREHYGRFLSSNGAAASLESTESAGTPRDMLTPGAIQDRAETAASAMHRIVTDYLGDTSALHRLADKLAAEGHRGLRALADGDEQRLAERPRMVSSLEAIVRLDGSRPSFMIREGRIDFDSSPIGTWQPSLSGSAAEINKAIACVGRIDDPSESAGFQGTGFLIHENLILTNRHVLQVIADKVPGTGWKMRAGITIDFGHEFRGHESVNRRKLKSVVFTGAKSIGGAIDHSRLDLALIELEPTTQDQLPKHILAVDVSPDWAAVDQVIYTIGYPAAPAIGDYKPSLLEQLFQSTYGYKRLAPGLVMPSKRAASAAWTTGHDATTIGGNSGSVVLVQGRETLAAGLHYGGRRAEPRENWAHVLGRVMDATQGADTQALKAVLKGRGVTLVDRTVSPGG